MSTIKVVEVLSRAVTILQDKTNVRWTIPELVGWFNDAQLQVVNKRPDSLVNTEEFTCVLGTFQALPSNGLRFIKVVRNQGVKKTPIRPVDMSVLDEGDEDWHDDASAEGSAKHYVYDNRDPKHFYLYPAVLANTKVLLSYSVAPTAVVLTKAQYSAGTDEQLIQLDDSYISALLDWILYRCYSKDSNHAANATRSSSHYQAFYHGLGIKLEGDTGISVNSETEGQ